MTQQEAQKLGVESLQGFAEGLIDLIDLGTEVAKDGVGVEDLVQLIKLPGIVDNLKEAPLAVAELWDIDEAEYEQVKGALAAKVGSLNTTLTSDKIKSIAAKVLEASMILVLQINNFRN